MGSSDQFNIRWNNYSTVLQNCFRKLLEGEQLVDVTLACEGQSIKCHRLILSACSTYFDRILKDHQSSNLVIYLTATKFWELRALVKFMYNGEVNINPQKLRQLFKAAETLKVKGLTSHDNGLTHGDMIDRLDENEVDDYHSIEGKEVPVQLQNSQRDGPIQHGQQQKSVLRQRNNLAVNAAAEGNQQPLHIKRKILMQLPKLGKMQRVEQKTSNGAGSAVGGRNLKIQQLPVNKIPVKIPDAVEMNRASVSKVMENYKGEGGHSMQYDGTPDSSVNDDGGDIGDGENNEETDGGGGNEHLGSEGDDSQLGSGRTLRQCSETCGISKKPLSKWMNEAKLDEGKDATSPNMTKEGGESMSGTVVQSQTRMAPPVNSAERAERLRKATELALSGATVRRAAADFKIPRTTLCAYMKRRGLAAKRNFLTNISVGSANNLKQRTQEVKSSEANNTARTNVQSGGNSSAGYFTIMDFPYLFLDISQSMDEMSQGSHETEEYAEEEEEYPESK